MLLETNQKLDDLIVELLSEEGSLSAHLLRDQLLVNGKEFSIQAIYKTLGRLHNSGVIVKNKMKYSLRLSWVVDLSDLANNASRNYLKVAKKILPRKGHRIIWHFQDLLALNNFWSQILLLLIEQSADRTLCSWMPHPWFHLVYSEQEQQYIRSLSLTDTKLYIINGGNTFLDKWTEKFWQSDNIEYSFAESIFSKTDPDVYINIIDDYVITMKLDSNIIGEIDNLYDAIQSMDDVDFSELFRVFGKSVRARLWLENNPLKAELYRKRFKTFFG